jgi:hypothetical protein
MFKEQALKAVSLDPGDRQLGFKKSPNRHHAAQKGVHGTGEALSGK